MTIELGKEYIDPITGFTGVAVCRTTYLYGCDRIGLQAKVTKEGKVPPFEYFDELQLQKKEPNKRIGGPQPNPPPLQHP